MTDENTTNKMSITILVILRLAVAFLLGASADECSRESPCRSRDRGLSPASTFSVALFKDRLHAVLTDRCLAVGCKEEDTEQLHLALHQISVDLVTWGFTGPSPLLPMGLLHSALERFLVHDNPTVRSVDGASTPVALRGWPDLSLARTLVGILEYFWVHCVEGGGGGSGGSSSGIGAGHLCEGLAAVKGDAIGPATSWIKLATLAAQSHCAEPRLSKQGKEYHDRKFNELPLRRATLAHHLLTLVSKDPTSKSLASFGTSSHPHLFFGNLKRILLLDCGRDLSLKHLLRPGCAGLCSAGELGARRRVGHVLALPSQA